MLKNGLATFRGDLKEVMDKYLLILRRQYREITVNMEQDRQKRSHITNIPLFARVIEKVTSYALNHVFNHREEMEKA